MTLIRVECIHCNSILQAPSELAGAHGTCPKCGAAIAIPPRPETPAAPPVATTPPLNQATAVDMMAELFRRKKSAVLVVFDTPTSGAYELSSQPDANVRCYRTEDMSDFQLMQVLEHVGRLSQGMRNAKGGIVLRPPGEVLAFELKGDRLGMTLDEFKAKYARKIGGITMPYCSDAAPGQGNSALWTEPWHAAAGLVSGRVDLPSEDASPTIAGVKTELMLYQFVDGLLYQISALFDTEAFHLIREALTAKHGPPLVGNKEPLEVSWQNAVSTIRLVRGTMRPKKPSLLQLIHHDLRQTALSRLPKRESDI